MKTLLFQGDSITDTGRNKEIPTALGSGYALMTAGKISVAYPGEFQCLNRGISGNRVVDLYARIKKDVINLSPDILTVLIGVNDVWHEFGSNNGVCAEKFEMILDLFIQEVKAACPDIQIVMLETFVLPGTATETHWEGFSREVKLRAQVCKRIADKYALTFVPLQDKLEELAAKTSPAYVLKDGVHPTCAGHEVISQQLFQALKNLI